jgi:predicted permease
MHFEWLHAFTARVKALVCRRQLERDLEDELSLHVAMKTDGLATKGMPVPDAQRAARHRFGNATELRERTRDEWMFIWFESIWQDLRYGWRTLWRSPGFAITALVALAFGIGANTAIFSLVHAALLRSAPYEASDRLVALVGTVQRQRVERRGASFLDYLDWREASRSFDDMSALGTSSFTLTSVDEPERLNGEYVSPQYFRLLGVSPIQGRTFTAGEGKAGSQMRVAVISEGLWKRRFGSSDIAGGTIRLSDGSYQIVGVMPQWFGGLSDEAQIWLPFSLSGFATGGADRGTRGLQVLARLKAGVSLASAQAEMTEICRRLEREYPNSNRGRSVEIAPLATVLFGDVRDALLLLLAAVAFVLLIACANVASLLIARAEARQREMAIRAAIGAGSSRLFRQLTTESCLLAGLGTLLGLALAKVAIVLLIRFSPITFPSWVKPGIDPAVAAFAIALALATGLLLGVAPALHARLARLHEALKQSSSRGTGSRLRLRQGLVAAETALALVLVIAAGLMIRSFGRLTSLNPGFDPQGMLTLSVGLPPLVAGAEGPPVTASLILERVRAIPGVQAAAATSALPLSGDASAIFYTAEGQPPVTSQNMPRAYIHWITRDYFKALGTPLLAGRLFHEGELQPRDNVVIVGENVIRRSWPGQDPIGKRIKRGGPLSTAPWLTIVGVVPEIRHRGLPENPTADPDLYFPLPAGVRQLGLVVRAGVSDPASLLPAIRRAVQGAESSAPIYRVATMEERVARQTARLSFVMWLLAIFGTGALVLAAVGVYAVLAYAVARRTREIGVRVALGARRVNVIGMVMRQGLGSVLIGLAAGLAVALLLTGVMRRVVYGITATDPTSFAGGAAVLFSASVVACLVPAWRACRLDPNRALREE